MPTNVFESQQDDQLIANGLQGDHDAFNVLFSRYRRLLHRLAYRVLHNCEEAEDAVQNCSLLAYRQLRRFKHDGAFRSWLVRILINESISILRSRQSRLARVSQQTALSPLDLLDTLPHPGPNPEEVLAKKQSASALAKQLSKLSPSQRSIVLLRGLWEYTTEETGAILNVSPTAVRARLFRARKQLADAIRKRQSTDCVK